MPDISQSSWSEVDASNNAAPPAGFPENQAMSSLNDSSRAVMGGVKRFWDRINPVLVSTGTPNNYVVTPPQALSAYAVGEIYSFRANFANTGTATLSISGLPAATLKILLGGIKVNLTGGEIGLNQPVQVMYDGTDMVMMGGTKIGGGLGSRQVFTASGSWTRPAGCRAIDVEVVGGGGGGGGATGTAAAQHSAGSPGGGGGYSRKFITTPGATETVTVGAGGTVTISAAGGAGGTSSFGTTPYLSATGGAGGAVTGAAGAAAPGFTLGGTGSGGDVNLPGGIGAGSRFDASINFFFTTSGGSSVYGVGGAGFGSANVNGQAGSGYGAGGSGGYNAVSQGTAKSGGAGAPGIVIVHEYY